MKFNVHGGHNSHVTGASKYLNELKEDRKVKNEVIRLLKAQGHTVYDCTDDAGTTQSANLSNIVKKCNAHSVDLDISIHLNAGGGTGVECWIYPNSSSKDEAARICSKVSSALGIKNRGVKTSTSLYVLKSTKAPAVLVECCFVDSKTDKEKWDAKKCAKAIVEGILNKSVSTSGSGSSSSSSSLNSSSSGSSSSSSSSSTYYKKYTGTSGSIVSALNAIGVNSSYSNREKIAKANGISNYSGTAEQNTKMLTLLKQGKLKKAGSTSSSSSSTSYYKKYTGDSGSIVTALNAIGVDSSYSNREKIAKKNGISNYRGTAEQNTKLLKLLKQGKLKK